MSAGTVAGNARRWSRHVRQAWRVFSSGTIFVLFGLGGLLLGGVVLPLLYCVPASAAQRRTRARRVIGGSFALFVWVARLVGSIDVRVTGADGLRLHGVVIAPTHPTLIDVILLLALAPQLECVVKRAVWRNPFMAGVVSAAGYIDNSLEGPQLLERCTAVLHGGGSILIFPEGSRTDPGVPVRLRRGAAAIALNADAPLIPVVIRCSPPALTKRQRWYDLPPDPLQIRIDVHAPLLAPDYLARAANRAMAARRMTSDLEDFYRTQLQNCAV